MKNTYFTSYFPLITILLFSASLSIVTVMIVIDYLQVFGIYDGMLEFFSNSGIKLALFTVFSLLFFMLFSALKLIANTVTELSLLFFSKDVAGENLTKIRGGSSIYLIGGALSLAAVQYPYAIIGIFLLATLIYFVFIVYKFSQSLTSLSLIGLVLFHVLFWFIFILGTLYLCIRLYNSVMASLPV
ncbi:MULTISPECIES: DUF5366 family protein [Bacillaceae]|uniref:DUF5366 family protein n=1 Tax=Bacillaceae TaxID=186817 RepID=UPI000BFC0542|nr:MULTISPECIES: DUF5366 family protein [Bacillaceae]PGT89285.1 hypothetical protein COD11_04610 [Bacillus sp. AFS040349]UGB30066.1 YufK family protein [Metabacillus sp. B2-18]